MSEPTRIRVRELFAAAAELPPAERPHFLDRECRGDARVREQVASLLSAFERAGTFLADAPEGSAKAPPRPVDSASASVAEGSAVGPYKLLQLLGEGGFGEVWMAQQESPVRRRVALKILKLGMDSRRIIARFEQERQALALMDHPNIARVLHAGTSDTGRPYFVMELVRGTPVTQFCDQHKLTVEQRLRLFRDVCDAVQHAHSKGVIHRDLKPSNVLVAMSDSGGGTPLPKVIDFGIAKATCEPLTDRTLFTELHAMIGTPAYMSPEQAEMNAVDIDTRSDIYSLGVLLYELLTGTPPLEAARLRSAGLAEIQRLIRDEPPVRPSARIATLQRTAERGSSEVASSLGSLAAARSTTPMALQRRLNGELDWIILKAIEKDRNRRYPTASALALDVQRFLNREPVEAGPASVWYRARKFVQRNGATVVAVAAIVLTLIIATGVSVFAWMRAIEREHEAVSARRSAESAQAEAMRERDEARRARDGEAGQRRRAELQERAARQITDFTTEILALADPRVSQRPNATVHELLDLASQKVEQQFADSPLAEASIRGTIGKAYVSLLKYDAAIPQLTRAIQLLQAAGAPAEHELYELHMARARAARSADALQLAISEESQRALFQHIASLDPELAHLLQQYRQSIDREYWGPGGFPETRALLDRVMARAEVVMPRGHPDRAFLGLLLMIDADWTLILSQDEFSIELSKQGLRIFADEDGQSDAQTLSRQLSLIFLHTNFEHWDAAERLIAECADRAHQVLGDDHPVVLALDRERAECAAARGDVAAISRIEELIAEFERQSSRYNAFTLYTRVRLARALERAGRVEEADAQRRRLAEIILAHDSRCDQYTIERLSVGRTFWEAARFALGPKGRELPRDQFQAGFLEIIDRIAGAAPAELAPDDPRRAILARMLTDLADYMEELAYIKPETVARTADLALELAEPFEDRAPFVVSRALNLIAWHRHRDPESGDLSVGEQQLRRAVELRRRQERLNPWWAASAESFLAEFLLLQKRPGEAERILASAYATMFHVLGPDNGNSRAALRRILKACHDNAPAPAARESSGHVRALAHLLFAVALGADRAGGDAELRDLHRRLTTIEDDAAAMQELLAARRVRIPPQQDDLDRIAMLIQHWTQDYVAAGGSYMVGCALADDFLALLRAAPQPHAAAQRRLCWLAATICAGAGDASRGERYARDGLSLAGGEAGLWHALLGSVLGNCLFQQGDLAAAKPLVVSAFESLLVLQGAGHGDTGVALRRVVNVLEAQGDMDGAAHFAAQRLRQLSELALNADALNDSAWWIVRRPGRSLELYELALRGAEAATRLGAVSAARQNTLGVAQYRVGRFADAVATLKRSDELQTAGGRPPQIADWAFLAMAHHGLQEFAEAGRCLHRAEEIAGTVGKLDDEDAAFLAEAGRLLAAR